MLVLAAEPVAAEPVAVVVAAEPVAAVAAEPVVAAALEVRYFHLRHRHHHRMGNWC